MIALLASGSQEGFRILYENYAEALYGIIFRILENKTLTEDVLQDSFVKIWKNFNQYSPEKGKLFTWMLNVCKNQALDTLRSKEIRDFKKNQSFELATHENFSFLNMDFLDGIGLDKALAQLKPDHLELIHLVYFQGFTQEEISKKTNLPLGTVKTKIRMALKKLRSLIIREIPQGSQMV